MEKSVESGDVWTRRLASGWIYWPACVGGVLLIGLAVSGPEAARRLSVARQCAAMQAEVDALARTRDQLAAIEQALENDPAYTERIVRRELGVTRPGEQRLPQPVKLQSAARPQPVVPPPDQPAWLLVLAKFQNGWLRFAAMVVGATLLAVGVVVSLPGRPPSAGTA